VGHLGNLVRGDLLENLARMVSQDAKGLLAQPGQVEREDHRERSDHRDQLENVDGLASQVHFLCN
jgi:hypothetical protein